MSKKKPIEFLTEEQIAILPKYRDMGIKIGYATHPDPTRATDVWNGSHPDGGQAEFDKIVELTNKHRELCGVPRAKQVFFANSPKEVRDLNIPGITNSSALYGNQDIHWLNYYNYYRVELGLIEETEKIVHLLELTKYVGWMWMSTDVTIITKRPVEVNTIMVDKPFQNMGKPDTFVAPALHNLSGPSMVYADGYSLYHLWEYHIQEPEYHWIATTPADQMKMKDVMRIKNTDLKSLALKKIGIERAYEKMDTTTVHEKTFKVGGHYTLFDVDFGGGPERYLRMKCPSKGEVHIEGVPTDCPTVDHARQWRVFGEMNFNDKSFTYVEPKVQT